MSVRMMSLVFAHYPGAGGELVLALSLADHAHDDGGGIFPSISDLATKTRQSDRTVQRQLRGMEDRGWLECVQRSNGGRNRVSRYRINPEWVRDAAGFVWRQLNGDILSPLEAEKPRQNVTVSPPETVTSEARNGDIAVSPARNHQEPSITPVYPLEVKAGSAEPSDSDDRKAGEYMLAKLRGLNPEHREPNWARWCREIRLMRERDKRTHRAMCELFAWANADEFWQANILSPGKLRQKWDRLVLARRRACGDRPGGDFSAGGWVCFCGAAAVIQRATGGKCEQHRETA